MNTSISDSLIERELDQLRKELATLRSGVSYIEQAAALLRLCEQTVASLQDRGARSMNQLENAYAEVADGVKAANSSAQTLERLVRDMQAHPLTSLLEVHEGQLAILQERLECLAHDSQGTATKALGFLADLRGGMKEQGLLLKELDRAQATLAQGNREAILQATSAIETLLTGLQERLSEEAKHTRSVLELQGKNLELLEGKLTGRLVSLGRLVLGTLVLGAATLGCLVFLHGR